jgi:hypothetical protein
MSDVMGRAELQLGAGQGLLISCRSQRAQVTTIQCLCKTMCTINDQRAVGSMVSSDGLIFAA